MEPLFEARLAVQVSKDSKHVRGPWALPTWTHVSIGRLPGAGIHLPEDWIPTRLCRFQPFDRGWVVQLGRARAIVHNKYLGDMIFPARTAVALQPGRSRLMFPELDDHLRIAVVIGADQAQGLPYAEDRRDLNEEVGRTAYAAGRVDFTDHQRRVLAVTFRHLLVERAEAPVNIAAEAAARLGSTESAVKVALGKARKKVNDERWLNLETNDQLGHYLARLTRNLTLEDLPVQDR